LTEIPRILLIVAVHRMAGGSPESLPECLPDNTCFDICMDAPLKLPPMKRAGRGGYLGSPTMS